MFIIAADKGQKMIAALRLLKKPLREIEEKEARKRVTQHGIEQNVSTTTFDRQLQFQRAS